MAEREREYVENFDLAKSLTALFSPTYEYADTRTDTHRQAQTSTYTHRHKSVTLTSKQNEHTEFGT